MRRLAERLKRNPYLTEAFGTNLVLLPGHLSHFQIVPVLERTTGAEVTLLPVCFSYLSIC